MNRNNCWEYQHYKTCRKGNKCLDCYPPSQQDTKKKKKKKY